MVEDFSTT